MKQIYLEKARNANKHHEFQTGVEVIPGKGSFCPGWVLPLFLSWHGVSTYPSTEAPIEAEVPRLR
jgi:hypothetical protein